MEVNKELADMLVLHGRSVKLTYNTPEEISILDAGIHGKWLLKNKWRATVDYFSMKFKTAVLNQNTGKDAILVYDSEKEEDYPWYLYQQSE